MSRRAAIQARRIALQMIQTTLVCAPDKLRDPLRKMTRIQLIRTLAAWRPDLSAYREVDVAYRISPRFPARRYLELHDEVADLDRMIDAIVTDLAPELLERPCVGMNSAAQLLLAAGDNPERLKSGASFAALCGASPVPALGGETIHRIVSISASLREDDPPPAQPRRGPGGEQRPAHHRHRAPEN